MFLRLLTYLTNAITYDCPECGFNGDRCICDPPEYDKDDLALCDGCNEYACICGDYDVGDSFGDSFGHSFGHSLDDFDLTQ